MAGSGDVNRFEGTGTVQAWAGGPETPVQFCFEVTQMELARHQTYSKQNRADSVGKVWAAGVSFPDGIYRLKQKTAASTAEYQVLNRSDEWRIIPH